MRVEFFENNERINFELGKSNVFIKGIGGGKTILCELFNDCFSAKGSLDFVVNGVNVDKSMFNVVYMDEKFDFDDYLKFKVRGSMFKDFKTNVLNDSEEILNEFLIMLNTKLSAENFSKYFNRLNDSLCENEVILQSGLTSIEDVYDKIFSVIFSVENLAMNSKVEIVLKHMILFREDVKSTILIVDDYICKLGKKKFESIVELISKQTGIYVIFASSIVLSHNLIDNVYMNYSRVNYETIYKKIFLYSQWDKVGDFNSFYDANIDLLIEDDLVKSQEILLEYEMLFHDLGSFDEMLERFLDLADKILNNRIK